MTNYDFGDVILVPFPFTDQSASKKRPAVIASSPPYNRIRPDVIVMAISSRITRIRSVGDLYVSRWRAAGLLKPSVIKPVLTTVDKRLVLKRLGRLHPTDRLALDGLIRAIVGP